MEPTEESLQFEIDFLKRRIKHLKIRDIFTDVDMLEHNLKITELDLKRLQDEKN